MFEQLKAKKRKVKLRTDKRIERLEIQRTMKEMQFRMFRADNLRHFSIKPWIQCPGHITLPLTSALTSRSHRLFVCVCVRGWERTEKNIKFSDSSTNVQLHSALTLMHLHFQLVFSHYIMSSFLNLFSDQIILCLFFFKSF